MYSELCSIAIHITKTLHFSTKMLIFHPNLYHYTIRTFEKVSFNLHNEATKLKEAIIMSNNNFLSYRRAGNYLIHNLIIPPEEASVSLGKWSMLHKDYLKKCKKELFATLLAQRILYQHCTEDENRARYLFNTLIE